MKVESPSPNTARPENRTRASAPGKIFLLGEYAVLEGGPALLATVDRRVQGHIRSVAHRDVALIRAVRKHAGDVTGSLELDSKALYAKPGQKLGLGSSAACAVVSSALLLGECSEKVLDVALRAHGEVTGGGSGVDVVASYYGGVLVAHQHETKIERLPTTLPDVGLYVLYTGRSVRSSTMVKACRAAPLFKSFAEKLRAKAEEGIAAYRKGNTAAFLACVHAYADILTAMGETANVEVVTKDMQKVIQGAADLGAAAKPSGAGGGDVMVLFAKNADIARQVAATTGFEVLNLTVTALGLCFDSGLDAVVT